MITLCYNAVDDTGIDNDVYVKDPTVFTVIKADTEYYTIINSHIGFLVIAGEGLPNGVWHAFKARNYQEYTELTDIIKDIKRVASWYTGDLAPRTIAVDVEKLYNHGDYKEITLTINGVNYLDYITALQYIHQDKDFIPVITDANNKVYPLSNPKYVDMYANLISRDAEVAFLSSDKLVYIKFEAVLEKVNLVNTILSNKRISFNNEFMACLRKVLGACELNHKPEWHHVINAYLKDTPQSLDAPLPQQLQLILIQICIKVVYYINEPMSDADLHKTSSGIFKAMEKLFAPS